MADSRQILYQTGSANTPSIVTGITGSAVTALYANTYRGAWAVQNLGTNVLYVRLGTAATTSVFQFALKAGTANDDGTGGSVNQSDGTIYYGTISVAGTTPRFTVMEL